MQRGSLRWLEAELGRRGGNPAALRNIVYRDVGTVADKEKLAAILRDLAAEAGVTGLDLAPDPPPPAPLPAELELLGRAKKRVYKQFLAGVRAGRAPRLVVAGRAGAGKTVLLDHLAAALGQAGVRVRQLNLSGDLLAPLPASAARDRSFAVLAARQGEALKKALGAPAPPGALLVRVTEGLHFAGDPPRLPDGTPVTAAAWAGEVLLRQLPPGVSVLIALEDPAGWPAGAGEITELRPPTLTEARAYLMAKLGVSRAVADELARETGRHLDRLALLGGGGGDAARLLSDPDVRRLALALAVLMLGEGAAWPRPQALGARGTATPDPPVLPGGALAAALGEPVAALRLHARSLLTAVEADEGRAERCWRPSPSLWLAASRLPAGEVEGAARRFVGRCGPHPAPDVQPHLLAALVTLGDWGALVRRIQDAPDAARFLPPLWPRVRDGAGSPEREWLARAVVTHHTGRGDYHEPAARDALFTLLGSPHDAVRAWARVKLAESSVDAGSFEAATEQLARAELPELLRREPGEPWALAAQSDGLLVEAALARWQGDMDSATRAVSDPRTVQSGPRARLWRGLIAKDAGDWAAALEHLGAVPESSPLLSARARYQEGDMRLRLGQPQAALTALTDAARRLAGAGAGPEEQARVLARAGTAQRRLGQAEEALACFDRALALVPAQTRRRGDQVPRARLLSESVPVLLALGRPEAGLDRAAQALALLQPGEARRAEVAYRVRRTHYRVALAYLTRGRGLPYLQPFSGPERDTPDLAHARALLDELLRRAPGASDREQLLHFDMRLTRSLAEPDPRSALEHLAAALDMTDHPYAETQARALRAEVLLRAGDRGAALRDLGRAHALLRRVRLGLGRPHGAEEADPGLSAQLLALEARVMLAEAPDDAEATLRWLRSALEEDVLRPFRAGVWREAGHALESQPWAEAVLRRLFPNAQELRLPLRITDALVVFARQLEEPAP
ncbi:hypothetical protein SAMN04488058_101113 [Deinococcus reticulitermitis]|uniref:Uncharacterized protein n=1 Tax=Deinococcus reticulitermitis TaxID=856736 RepID=A0A1H6SAW9_9DEIO|nr:hypothetical protein SAMN04488058_101113 [Deinococcus reticulitermitis]